jgi:hypothetical protein
MKKNSKNRKDKFSYNSYVSHFSGCVHDVAKMQYTYTILYSVTVAMLQDYDENKFSIGIIGWTKLINAIKEYIGERAADTGLGLKASIVFMENGPLTSTRKSMKRIDVLFIYNSATCTLPTVVCSLQTRTVHTLLPILVFF